MPSATALMSALPAVVPTLAVSWGTQILVHPHVVQVRVANTGRRDILRGAFDGNQPIGIDVGEPILAVLATSSPCPSSTAGSELLIPPRLLKKDEALTFSLLVDGAAPRLVGCRAQLNDVEVHNEADDARQAAVRLAVLTRVGVAIATFGLVLWIATLV
ncbi:hypothetical protein [Embleya hyalina]|nr:hypothetical protein [Embleya hyalina]